MKTPHIWPAPFFQILSNPPPSPLPPTTPTALTVESFLWLNGWLCHIWCAILLNDILDLQVLSVGNLVLEGPWHMFYGRRHQVYRDLTHNAILCWYSDLISHTQTHTQRHTVHSGASRLTHPYIFTPHVMCSQQLSLLHWINSSLI